MSDIIVTLRQVDPPGPDLRFHLWGSAEEADGHDEGFADVDRPGRVAGIRYTGIGPYVWPLRLYTTRAGLDDSNVESKVIALQDLAEHRSWRVRPPTLTVSGPLPSRLTARRWVLHRVRPLDELHIRDPRTGRTAQQRVDVVLKEDVRPLVLTPVQAAQIAHSRRVVAASPGVEQTRRVGARKTARIASNEDGQQFAARVLGDAGRWPEIGALNGLTDPLAVVGGSVYRLPQ